VLGISERISWEWDFRREGIPLRKILIICEGYTHYKKGRGQLPSECFWGTLHTAFQEVREFAQEERRLDSEGQN
jgi:hypothetical protein